MLAMLASLALLGGATLPAWAQNRTGACLDVSGHYRIAEHSTAQEDVLKALDTGMAGFIGSEVMLKMSAGGNIALHVKSGRSGTLPAQPSRVLVKGVDFDCLDGAVALRRAVPAQRKGDTTFHEGQARVRLAPAAGSGLNFRVTFNGSQRTAIFGYESAQLSVPVLGTGVTQNETLRWPDISEPGPTPEPPPRQVSQAELAARRLLQPLLHPVILGGLQPLGDAVIASLIAPTSAHAVQFEERLRQAGVNYEMKSTPRWSNDAYFMEVLIRPARSASAQAAAASEAQRPSASWVTQAMNGAMHESGLYVTRVDAEGDTFIATLSVVGNPDPQRAIARLKLNASMFAVVVPLSEAPDAAHPNVRIARWKVLLREP
jgi:hypothetical protein